MKDLLDKISDKKQALYDAKNSSEFEKGENVNVPKELVSSYVSESDKGKVQACQIIKVNQKTLVVQSLEYNGKRERDTYKINQTNVVNRNLRNIGANPFDNKFDSVRTINFSMSSIIHSLDLSGDRREENYMMAGVEIQELNWKPYVYNKLGQKEYYQRGFVWTLQDKQLLIESIYQKLDCGKILIRLHGWKSLEAKAKAGEKELGFKDIVDGKQRMKTIQEFIHNKFPDMHGNYYGDLSVHAQYLFTDHQLFSYAEMPESTTDEEVIYQFLKMNFTGVPQSKEHLDFVKEIKKKM